MKQKAFTLPEVLVVMSIIIIMTVAAVVSYRPGEKGLALQRERVRFFQNVRLVQSMLGHGWEGCKVDGKYLEGYQYGYGLWFYRGRYHIFADCDGSGHISPFFDKVVEKVSLDEDIEIIYGSNFSIVFVLPDPSVHFGTMLEEEEDTVSEEISFRIKETDKKITIQINKLGLIEEIL